jgi:Cu(I)/Ag(I) efflux system membrane fusion protein
MFLVVGVALIAGIGVAQRFGWIKSGGGAAPTETDKETIYTCSMHPEIRQPRPGRCPICGMELVPAVSGGAGQDEFAVQIEPAARRLANIQTATARKIPLSRSIRSVGVIAYDESRLATISAYVDGRLERLFADYTGVQVAKGDHLVVLYSPMLYGAQAEFLNSKLAWEKSDQSTLPDVARLQQRLAESARQKLIEFGMTEDQVRELEKSIKPQSRLTIHAPIGGTVIEKPKVEGDYVKIGDVIYRIADLSTVWLMLKLFPEDAASVRFGQLVETEVQSLPGKTFTGRVAFIDPMVNEMTRTVNVRVELLNSEGRLRPGDYATAVLKTPITPHGQIYDAELAGKWISPMHPQIIRGEPGKCPICGMDLVPTSRYGYAQKPVAAPKSLVVPRDAVLMMGANSVVYVETDPGRFEIRPVMVGPLTESEAVILSGLKEGQTVATDGNFLIDSQMQLSGKPSLINPARALARKPGPLELDASEIARIGGQTGERIEALYAAYFRVHGALAADATVSDPERSALVDSARALEYDKALPEAARPLVRTVAEHAEHLHHLELAKARQAFKKISRAVLQLAASVRGADAKTRFVHLFCTMKHDGGERDWMQPEGKHNDPYCGKQMPNCGKPVETLPLPQVDADDHKKHDVAHTAKEK